MVKLQLLLHNFFSGVELATSYLDCATCLALYGYDKGFYKTVVDRGVYKSEQAARNSMKVLRQANIAVQEGKKWKINPEIALGISDVICLQLKAKNNPE